jgi:hypothetical protein
MKEIRRIWEAMDRSDSQGYGPDAHVVYDFEKLHDAKQSAAN